MDRLALALERFDRENAADPTRVRVDGAERPRELVQAERLSRWVDRLTPGGSEALRLAARCQHLCRWEIPRSTYPDGRLGYLEWRKALSRFHADRASQILRSVGYDEATIERVRTLNQKRGIKIDPEVQIIEDALCLVFLEHELSEFRRKHPDDKVIDIIRKTWRKMSDRGHDEALRLPLSDEDMKLVERALAP